MRLPAPENNRNFSLLMYLKTLALINFKNYRDFEAEFSPKVNCFVGQNGQGKTNLLDAIHYLSFCKSFFNPVDSQNITYDKPFFVIRGQFDKEGEEQELHCGLKRNQKKIFKRNKREYERLSEHIGQFPLVMISPSDSDLIYGSSEYRRKFIDGIISQYDRGYLEKLISYNQVLKHRNMLLKQFAEAKAFDAESLDIWDEQLVLHGSVVSAKRVEFLKKFAPLFNTYYAFISGSREQADLRYESSIEGKNFKTALMAALSRDRVMQYTGVGPHKDDLDFVLEGHSLKKFASQGQQKSFLLALKLAQFEFIREQKNLVPLLLLDDVYDKLDEQRFSNLLEIVSSENFGQVFITDTHPERMNNLLNQMEIEHRTFLIDQTKDRINSPAND